MSTTRAWAAVLYGTSTLFCDIPVGGTFKFPTPLGADRLHTKTSQRGWYKDQDGRRFQTGTRTAVIEVQL